MTNADMLPDSTVFNDIDRAVDGWLAAPAAPRAQLWLTGQVWYMLDGPAANRTSEVAKAYGFDAIIKMYQHNLERDLPLYAKNGSLLAEFLANERWRRLVATGNEYLFATMLISFETLRDYDLTKNARKAFVLWTSTTLPGNFDTHKHDVARILFGDIWLQLYGEELDASPAKLYQVICQASPTFAFLKNKSEPEQVTPVLPRDVWLDV